MPMGAIIVRCTNISNDEHSNDYECLVRYTIKHTPVHIDAHDNINLMLVNIILLYVINRIIFFYVKNKGSR